MRLFIFCFFIVTTSPILADASAEIDGLLYGYDGTVGEVYLKSRYYYNPGGMIHYPDEHWSKYPDKTIIIPSTINFPGQGVCKVTSIGIGAFGDCANLEKIVIPEGVTSISSGAFWGCSKLKTVILPSTLTNLGSGAFEGCKSIETIISPISRLFTFKLQFSSSSHPTFEQIVYDNAILYVPKDHEAKYRNVDGWKEFFYIKEYDFYSNHNLNYYVDGKIYRQYQLGFKDKIITPEIPWKSGYEFSGWSSSPTEMTFTDVNITALFTPKESIRINGINGKYATFYHAGADYCLPKGVTAQVATNVEGSEIKYKRIADGDIITNTIPKGVPVILVNKDKATSDIVLTISKSGNSTYTGSNLLRGIEESCVETGLAVPETGEYVYKLSYGKVGLNERQVIGWFWGTDNGGQFIIHNNSSSGNRAYLTVPIQNITRGIALDVKQLYN